LKKALTSGGGYGIILKRQGTAKQTAPKRSARIEASCEATNRRTFVLNPSPERETKQRKRFEKTSKNRLTNFDECAKINKLSATS
jgi:hypothetical protein